MSVVEARRIRRRTTLFVGREEEMIDFILEQHKEILRLSDTLKEIRDMSRDALAPGGQK